MTRALVALLAAFEAVITAAIGIGIALAPLTVVWAVQYRMAVSWGAFWRAATDAWLLGLGVDLHVDLDRLTALSVGLNGAVPSFTVTIAALGVSLFTVVMGARVGRRAAETPFLFTGALSSAVTFALVGWIVALTARATVVAPVAAQAAWVAGGTFAVGVALGIGLYWARHRDEVPGWVSRFMSADVRTVIGTALRAATAATLLLAAAAAVLVTLLLFAHFGKAVALYEGLQAGYLGGMTLTLAQLAFLPNAILWAMSWLIGSGFTLGGAVAPGSGGTTQLPGLPLMAIVPAHTPTIAIVVIAVPVLVAVVSGFLSHRALTASPGLDVPARLALIAGVSAVLCGIAVGVLAWWSGGTLAPGTLAQIGPNPLATGGFAALELGFGIGVGLFAGHFRRRAALWTPAEAEAPDRERELV